MDEKRLGNENPEASGGGSGGERTNLDLPLPAKDLLEHVIDVLQCGDKKHLSGQPVNPKEVPSDFRTIRAKVQDGIYNNLNQFESDILLILNNAMISTLPDTDYFKEVQAINDLAERVFNKLRTDPNRLKSEFPSKRSKRDRELGDEARSSSTKPGPYRKRRVGDPNDQPRLSTEEFCEKYDLLSQVRRNPSRFSRFSAPSESTLSEQTRCMPMPGIPSPTRQESQHQSAPHGQQGDIYPVEWGAPQQQRQFDDAGPWGRLKHQEPYRSPDPGVRPSESDPVGWAEWKEHEQALTTLGQTGYMPMPPQLGILQHLLGAPASQEPQHLSASHGQQGDTYAVEGGAPQQQRRCDDAGPFVQLTHQEPHHTSDPRVRPSGSNPVDQGQQGGIYAVNQGALQQQRQFYDAGPWGQLKHQESYHAPDPGVRPSESDPVGWAEWKEHEQALTTLGQTGYMPMPPQLGILQHLFGAPASQEPQNLSAPHGQQGDIYAVDRGAPQQQRRRGDAGPLVRLTHQEPHHTSDPHVRPSGSNPVDQGVRQEHEQVLTTLRQTGHMPMPARFGVPSNLHDAPTLQEPQHLSPPHGQKGGIYAVNQGAPQQQRQFDDAGPWGRLTHQKPYHTPDPGVRPSESDPVGWAEWKEHEQALTTLGQTRYMSMPPQLGIPQHLLSAHASEEPQHLSAPHGQHGDIYAVDRGSPQQQRQRDDAGPFGQVTHQEPYHASDPHVRPDGSNPVGRGLWQEQEQALPLLGYVRRMPLPARLGVPSDLHGAPALQEPQHLSVPHGQQGGINPGDRGTPQQQRQRVFARMGLLTLQEPDHASVPRVRSSGSNPVGQGAQQEHEQALITLGQTGSMPMPAQLGIQSELHGAPTLQEPQHLSAPYGQQGGINPVDRGAPQQQRQRVFAGPLGWLTLHEPQHASNPSVRPSGSNPVGRGVWHEQAHEQDFPQGRRHLNQGDRGRVQWDQGGSGAGAGAGNAYGRGAPQRGQQQQ